MTQGQENRQSCAHLVSARQTIKQSILETPFVSSVNNTCPYERAAELSNDAPAVMLFELETDA